MPTCNTLILSAGRRKRLYDLIVDHYQSNNIVGKIFVADATPELSSVCMSSENALKILKVNETGYIDNLKQIIHDHSINVVIPTIDPELIEVAGLGKNEHQFHPIISNPNIVHTFSTKTSTYNFFRDHNVKTPNIIKKPTKSDLPLFAKLDNSSSSVGAQKVETEQQLLFLLNSDKNYVFQEFIEGNEFTIDFFVDHNQELIAIIPRQRLEVRAGEVSKALTVNDQDLSSQTTEVIKKLDGAYGPMCIQAIKNKTGIYFIEINTRFGGGYPLTHQSGANFIEYIYNHFFGIPSAPNINWSSNMLMLRYDHEVIVSGHRI